MSKEASWPQQLQQLIFFLLINCFIIFKLMNALVKFFHHKYLKSFVFPGPKMGILRQQSRKHLGFWIFTCHFIYPKGMGLACLLIHTKSWCIRNPPGTHVCKVTFKKCPISCRSHIQLICPPKNTIVRGVGGVPNFFSVWREKELKKNSVNSGHLSCFRWRTHFKQIKEEGEEKGK